MILTTGVGHFNISFLNSFESSVVGGLVWNLEIARRFGLRSARRQLRQAPRLRQRHSFATRSLQRSDVFVEVRKALVAYVRSCSFVNWERTVTTKIYARTV